MCGIAGPFNKVRRGTAEFVSNAKNGFVVGGGGGYGVEIGKVFYDSWNACLTCVFALVDREGEVVLVARELIEGAVGHGEAVCAVVANREELFVGGLGVFGVVLDGTDLSAIGDPCLQRPAFYSAHAGGWRRNATAEAPHIACGCGGTANARDDEPSKFGAKHNKPT